MSLDFGLKTLRLRHTIYYQLRLGLASGVEYRLIFRALRRGLRTASARNVVDSIATTIKNGDTLTNAMQLELQVFPEWQTKFIAVGETSGRLPEVLASLEEFTKFSITEIQTFLSRSTYPFLLLHVAAFLEPIVPLVTGELSALAYFGAVLVSLIPIYLTLFGLTIVPDMIRQNLTIPAIVHKAMLAAPIIGGFMRALALHRFSKALRLMYVSGNSLQIALPLAADASGNNYLRLRAQNAVATLDRGGNLAEAFAALDFVPQEFMNAIVIGETSGSLDKNLKFIEQQSENQAHTAASLAYRALYVVVFLYVLSSLF